ncbi:MAG: 3-oxoacid CoA-transferase subunit A [Vibrio hibernica]
MSKVVKNVVEAITLIKDGDSIFVGGFGEAGSPIELLHALVDHGARDLTIISNNAGNGYVGLAALINAGQVKKMVCSFPRSSNAMAFTEKYRAGEIELDIVPQGTLAERIRCGGAGIPGFYTPTGVGTPLSIGKEEKYFDGKPYLLERALTADVALIKAECADTLGNLTYNKTARNFNPMMCTAAKMTIVQARCIVQAGEIDPENVITPQLFVNKLVEVSQPLQESDLIRQEVRYPW